MNRLKQHLAVPLLADVVGYTRMMAVDDRRTLRALDQSREIFRRITESLSGRVIDMSGDSILVLFETAGAAVEAGIAIQAALRVAEFSGPDDQPMRFRIGIDVGELIQKEDGTVYGDSINIAARIEAITPAGEVAVSRKITELVEGKYEFLCLGDYRFKNVDRPIDVFLVDTGPNAKEQAEAIRAVRFSHIGNLPVQASELLGRDDAVKEVSALLEKVRLITLFGPGGMGKTRLSIAAAANVSSKFPDGVWFVELAALLEPSAIVYAVAGMFSVTQQADKTLEASLAEALTGRRLLLVLDNCEHVTEEAAKLADMLLTACPLLRIVASSREALQVNGETVWPVPALGFSGDETSAVSLFVMRARAVAADFELGDQREVVSNICQQLDGIPLAIELAATRVRSMTPAQILDRLDHRFRLLTGGSTAVRERHQTLLNIVQWSYDLISDRERSVLLKASIFVGGFGLAAAETVCRSDDIDEFDVMDLLDSLARKSLLVVVRTESDIRFHMLETIRHFCKLRLEEQNGSEDAKRAHAEFYASESDQNFKHWRSPAEGKAYRWLNRELSNLRVAFRWAVDSNHVDIAARIASNVGDIARFQLNEEAASWAEEIVDKAREAQHPRLIVLLTWCASSAWAFSRFEDAQRFGDEALSLRDDSTFDPFHWAYGDLAFVASFAGDIDKAVAYLREGVEHPCDSEDRFMSAFLLYFLAITGRRDEAREEMDKILSQVDAAGLPMSVSVAYTGKGAFLEAEDPEAALNAYEYALSVARKTGAPFMESLVTPRIAAFHARGGDPVAALAGFERMMAAFGSATDIASVSALRASLAVLMTKLGEFEVAATLHGTMVQSIDVAGLVPEFPAALEQVKNAMERADFESAANHGAVMTLAEASRYAIDQVRRCLQSMRAERGHLSVVGGVGL